MSGDHFELSPSAAHRWMRCPGSVALSRGIEDVSSAAADEGTLAHEIAAAVLLDELAPKNKFRGKVINHPAIVDLGESNAAPLQDYVDYCREHGDGGLHAVEVSLDLSPWLGEGGFGTSDMVIYQAKQKRLKVIDLKFGRGHIVYANEKVGDTLRVNSQLGLYGLGSHQVFHHLDIDEIELTIHQPRRQHISTILLTPDLLISFGKEVREAVQRVTKDPLLFAPGEKQCQWCPARGICAARSEWHLDAFARNAATLTPHEISHLLHQTGDMRAWCDDIETQALRSLTTAAGSIPGWKLVSGRSVRQWTGEAEQQLVALLKDQAFERSLIGIGKAEKLARAELTDKNEVSAFMSSITVKREGRPTMVPDSDPRSALGDATEGFSLDTGESE